jgi:hypothetical protein
VVENANKVKKALKNKKIDIAINTNWPFIGPFMKFLENTGVMKELKKITAKQIRIKGKTNFLIATAFISMFNPFQEIYMGICDVRLMIKNILCSHYKSF